MVSTSLMVDTSSHPRAQLHRCVERSAYDDPVRPVLFPAFQSPREPGVCRSSVSAQAEQATTKALAPDRATRGGSRAAVLIWQPHPLEIAGANGGVPLQGGSWAFAVRMPGQDRNPSALVVGVQVLRSLRNVHSNWCLRSPAESAGHPSISPCKFPRPIRFARCARCADDRSAIRLGQVAPAS
jgi:hypothetical protein